MTQRRWFFSGVSHQYAAFTPVDFMVGTAAGVGPFQVGGHLRRGALRLRHPELEAAINYRLERYFKVKLIL
jgi:hypothetical protein